MRMGIEAPDGGDGGDGEDQPQSQGGNFEHPLKNVLGANPAKDDEFPCCVKQKNDT